MSVQYSNFKRLDIINTVKFNYLLNFYAIFILEIGYWIFEHRVNFNILNIGYSLAALFLLPLMFSAAIGPFTSFVHEFAQSIPIPLISSSIHLVMLPINILCCALVFTGSILNFVITLIFPKIRLADDPQLFSWNVYIFLLKE